MEKDEALAELGARSDASFAEAKKAFRRQAMKWHPDRNKSPSAEERFKAIRASFEWLEAIHEAGAWASHVDSEPARPPVSATSPASAAPKPAARKSWDPPEGPLFDLGSKALDSRGQIGAFFDSFMAVHAAMESRGAAPSMIGVWLSRGLNGFLVDGKVPADEIATLRGEFLSRFWSTRRVGLWAALDHARRRLAEQGWANSVVESLDPAAELHAWRDRSFYIFERACLALPGASPTGADLSFYREWIARMPELFSNFGANERALRFGLSVRGVERGPLFMEAALARSPKVAEIFAALCAPGDFATKDDWLGMALSAGLDPGALAPWLMADPIKALCERIPKLSKAAAAKVARVAESRLEREEAWHLAGPWASPRARAMGAAHRRWIAIVGLLDPSLMGAAKRAMGIGRGSVGLALARSAIFSPLPELAKALGPAGKAVPAKLRKEALGAAGVPLAVACAMRAYFDQAAPMDFMERYRLLSAKMAPGELSGVDPQGRGALEWFEMALTRRGV